MKHTPHRLVLIALAAAAVVSCDTRLPTVSRRIVAGTPPTISLDSPLVNSLVNLGDSILVRAHVTGGNHLQTLTLRADALTGDKDLGTFQQTPRFGAVTVNFPSGVTDTTIRRYLKAIDPANQNLDSLLVIAHVVDSLGLSKDTTVRATIVSGPHVTIDSPFPNDSVPAGVSISVEAHAMHPDGISQITISVVGDPTWPTKLNAVLTQNYDGSSRDVIFTGTVPIPLDAPQGSRFSISASSLNTNKQPGSAAPISIKIRSNASISAPRVTQVVPPIAERTDLVHLTADGQGITEVGVIVRDITGLQTGARIDSVPFLLTAPFTANVVHDVALRLPLAQQGHQLFVTAYAIDQVGRVGYAVRTTTNGSETNRANAVADSINIVYGQTYAMPFPSTVGDVAVDPLRGTIFMSNTSHNRLEMLANGTRGANDVWTGRTFNPSGIAVGSQPWGMTLSALNPDLLLVANSGGTNISQVCIANCAGGGPPNEVLANRILTRGVYVYNVVESTDPATGRITLSVSPPIQYSDRPQYIAQASTGRVYFSTEPTPTASNGTIRWLDPTLPAPDPQIINAYAVRTTGGTGTTVTYTIFNVDSVAVLKAPTNSPNSDVLFIWDHPYGQTSGVICVNAPAVVVGGVTVTPACPQATTGGVFDPHVATAIATLAAQATCSFGPCPATFKPSDVNAVLGMDVTTLGLSDTTFVASSVSRNWIAFGEGNTGPAGRVMLTADSLVGGAPPPFPQFFSPQVTVTDLTNNAAERVFGLALDKSGKTVASHGKQSYFSTVEYPFHLRLQGKYDSFDDGAGIALHPSADGLLTPADQRLAFVGAGSGRIEIVDIAFYINRGTLALKYPIYGPLRASLPMPGDNVGLTCPGDPACVVLKLFAITTSGLIVIDLTAADIKPGP